MDGRLFHFDDEAQTGEVEGSDGKRYPFDFAQWRGRGLPSAGTPVRFELRDGQAIQVFNRPEAQRRASSTRGIDGKTRRKRLSHWALAAFVVSVVGLSAGRYAPVVEVVAIVLAWLGLRHVHRQPQQFKGYWLSGAAIAIAVGVTLWSQL
ncbi:hypothetical protein R5R73_07460 [Salinicola sp. LHM]|jgi:hypothetical protein|uniref:hypothetical protein n=1 Tax=Salinicola TaxID=404432 RepID=UPI0008DD2108|nr:MULTISPECIES: hypothetical protein [Salinicola]MDF3919095.1 hypothetical protein [Salinicola salarius]OHY97948.1 hypothetical protein BC443_03850 [Salinicola sp. MIT1003]WQH34516.1 hypothetical protein R5R73_07460 [Salinicola sp. LHM]